MHQSSDKLLSQRFLKPSKAGKPLNLCRFEASLNHHTMIQIITAQNQPFNCHISTEFQMLYFFLWKQLQSVTTIELIILARSLMTTVSSPLRTSRRDGPLRRLLFLTAVETGRQDGCQKQQLSRRPVVTGRSYITCSSRIQCEVYYANITQYMTYCVMLHHLQ